MTARWRVLVVDDNDQAREAIKLYLGGEALSADGGTCNVDAEPSFENALARLSEAQYDLVVLDIRDDSLVDDKGAADAADDEGDRTPADVGLDVAEAIRARQFVPIVFFSAVPHYAEPKEPFVSVLHKDAGVQQLLEVIKQVFESGLPSVHQALLRHVEVVTRDFMAAFVETNWADMTSAERKGDMAHLLSRRLGASLSSGGDVLAAGLAGEPNVNVGDPGAVHPMRLYIIPPVGDLVAGELLYGPRLLPHVPAAAGGDIAYDTDPDGADVRSSECWYIILTPSCDLVAGHLKADYVVVAECRPFEECDEYLRFKTARDAHNGPDPYAPAGDVKKRLSSLFMNNRKDRQQDRDYFLPAAWGVPALLADFQRIAHVPHADLGAYQRRAQLDGPYAEALINRATRYLGRVGTPDLDIDHLLSNIV